jgi:hypothetical protein
MVRVCLCIPFSLNYNFIFFFMVFYFSDRRAIEDL